MSDVQPQNRRPYISVTIGRPTSTDANGRVRRTQTYRINRWNILAEWISSVAAVSLISFYSFALLTTPADQRSSTTYKLLAANVLMSCYMRLCYILHTSSKSYVLMNEGETETANLPLMNLIESVSSAMFLVEPGHFVCLCWITHISFPFKPCDGLSYWAACTSLHVTSTIFVAAWTLTGLAFAFITMCFTMFERSRSNEVHRTLRNMAPIPSQLREGMINALPLSEDPPPDGEVCAICCDIEEQVTEGGAGAQSRWRVLPCGHRFHPSCVDDWLRKSSGTCPTCRHDPALGPTGRERDEAQGGDNDHDNNQQQQQDSGDAATMPGAGGREEEADASGVGGSALPSTGNVEQLPGFGGASASSAMSAGEVMQLARASPRLDYGDVPGTPLAGSAILGRETSHTAAAATGAGGQLVGGGRVEL